MTTAHSHSREPAATGSCSRRSHTTSKVDAPPLLFSQLVASRPEEPSKQWKDLNRSNCSRDLGPISHRQPAMSPSGQLGPTKLALPSARRWSLASHSRGIDMGSPPPLGSCE